MQKRSTAIALALLAVSALSFGITLAWRSGHPSVPRALVSDRSAHTVQEVTTASAPEAAQPETWLTFTSEAGGFRLRHPESAQESFGLHGGYVTVAKEDAFTASLKVPPGTNLGEALVAVAWSAGEAIFAKCQQPAEGEQAAAAETFGSSTWSTFDFRDAAAGNRYTGRRYRTVSNGRCYELTTVLHSSAIENYPEGAVRPFDEADYAAQLARVVQTIELGSWQMPQ